MQPFDSFLSHILHFNGYVCFSSGGANSGAMLMRATVGTKLYVSRLGGRSWWVTSLYSVPTRVKTAMMMTHSGMGNDLRNMAALAGEIFPAAETRMATTTPEIIPAPT